MAVWVGDSGGVCFLGESWVFGNGRVVEELAEVLLPAIYAVMFCGEHFASTVFDKEVPLSCSSLYTAKEVEDLSLVVMICCCF